MGKFLETLNLPKLNHEETENLNRLTSSKDIELVSQNSQQIKAWDQITSQVKLNI